MTSITLDECTGNNWYQVIKGCPRLNKGVTFLYINKNTNCSHFVISDHFTDETGVIISEEDSKIILVEKLVF